MTKKDHPSTTSDEALRKVTIGEPALINGPIRLSEYRPEWPSQFDRQARRIRAALGDQAIRIEHVGSTAVPGLVAKPIIDILLVVRHSEDEASYVPALEAVGYVLRIREPEWHQHRLLKGRDPDVNLHVFSSGSSEIERMLLMRDRLRADRTDRELYAQTKRDLASRDWKYMQNYADAKSAVVEAILARAREATPDSRSVAGAGGRKVAND